LIELPTMEPPPPPYVDLAAFSAATGGVSNGDSENAESAAIASQVWFVEWDTWIRYDLKNATNEKGIGAKKEMNMK